LACRRRNAAIDKGVAPAEWTRANIADMKAQMQPLGLAFDWSREVATCDASYYKWNQWLFLKMLDKASPTAPRRSSTGTRSTRPCSPTSKVIDGRGWRSNAVVERREIPGYYLAITRYADELLASLEKLDGWPPQVRAMQENWIGRSIGVNFGFPYELDGQQQLLRVFTTRADTICGVTFVAVAASTRWPSGWRAANPRLAAFIEECRKGAATRPTSRRMEKKGVATGFFVEHPLTGERIEVWVGNYVLMGYGEGAVMGVPAHDQRDFEFAKSTACRSGR